MSAATSLGSPMTYLVGWTLAVLLTTVANAEANDKNSLLSPAERRTIARNMGESEKTVMEIEAQCAKGFRHSCSVLDAYKTKTSSQMLDEANRSARLACAQGDRTSCDALTSEERNERAQREGTADLKRRLIERYRTGCAAGDKQACKNLADLNKR